MWTLDPFPHAILDGWFDPFLLARIWSEMPLPHDTGWHRYQNALEGKLEGGPHLWGDATRQYFAELAARTPQLEEMSGIANLSMETVGGGYHLIPPDTGRLEVHTDFNRSPTSNLYRRLNVLTYLNADWEEEPGGCLLLRSPDGTDIAVRPEFGRTVIFETSDTSWHGHPFPASRWRASIAAYFFSPDPPPGYRADHSTVWWHDA